MDPRQLAAWTRDALRHHQAGRLEQARPLYEQVLRFAPGDVRALHGLGVLLQPSEPERAARLLRAAIAARPGVAIYWNNLGNALRALARRDEAEAAYRESLRLDPRYALAAYNLGALKQDSGEPDAARAAFETALRVDPSLAAANQALADLSRREGRVDDAITHLERAVAAEPRRAAIYNDLGALYQLRGRVEAALACFDRACELDPGLGEARFNRGKLQEDLGRFEAAAADLESARRLAPRLATEAACHLAVVQRHLCDWQDEAQRTAGLVGEIEVLLREHPGRGLPALALNVVEVPAPLRLAVARHLARGLEEQTAAARARCGFRHAPRSEPARLRIGYVSPDFRQHAVGTLVHDLFRHHDRSAVTVHAYSLIAVDDPFQRSVCAGVDVFADVSRESPEVIARRIHADRIDVLVDLAGYTTYSRSEIFALRPAPVQAHWLGYLDTQGAEFLPYLIADEIAVPPGAEAQLSETVVSLPHGFVPVSRLPIAETPPRTALGLPEHAFVFCCMNGLYKLDAETFAVWMRILSRVQGSVLWLADEGSACARENLAREASAHGVDPSRLVFAPRQPLPRYLARYRAADLFLDTFAYNAGATAVGALAAGLPVLTRPGERMLARIGASLVTAAALPNLVCVDTAMYEERAVALAADPAALAALRRQLSDASATARLFDLAGFARQLEAAYRAMWRDAARGDASRRLAIEVGG
jgi:predicted O-linked N-acetylglucosamine transferase (SPINDLY family)